MSLSEVQARTQAIEARLRSLAGAPTQAGGTLGTAITGTTTPGSAPSFASELRSATPAAGTTATPAGPSGAAGPTTRWSHPRASAAATGERAVALASQHLGTPYAWGGESPGGFDCSGLVQWTYAQLGVDLPRVSTDQARAGREVSAAEARPGDLVFFERGAVDHIGIYAGAGTWVVAPKTGDVVKVAPVDLSKATTIRRVLPEGGVTASRSSSPATGASWAAGLPASGRRFADDIATAATETGVDPRLLSAVAWSESGFDPSARSSAGAQGLMQLMPRTAQGLGVDPLDPAQALRGGGRYLAQQLSAFGGSVELALAAYNAGPTAVRKHGGIPPYDETRRYVTTVLDRYRSLGGAA